MGFKKEIKGLDEEGIKKYIKKSILSGNEKVITNSKILKKSKYLQDITTESVNEFQSLIEFLENNFECPIERYNYLEKNLN